MTAKDCVLCHKPHAPSKPVYGADVAASLCGACHAEAATAIAKEGGAHKEVGCAGCHANHGEIPACADCHAPAERAHYALSNCGDCHAPHAPMGKSLAEMKDLV